jgi:hypothetical protein
MDREIARRPRRGRALASIRGWLREGAVVPVADAADAPLYTLSAAEQMHLAWHLDAIAWCPRFTFSMMRSGSAAQTNGLGLRLCSPR